jgi:type IV pilus assembly protein PilM
MALGLDDLFTKKQPPLVGIDISSSAVKVLELSKSGEHVRVEHAMTEVAQVAEAVERAVKRSGTKLKHAAVAIPAAHVITKIIRMPAAMSDQERHTQIEMEADHYIPYPLDEVNLDYCVIGQSESNAEEADVLMAACRKEVVDDYLAVISGPGLTPHVVDVETFAMENAYGLIASHMPGGGMEKTVAILDVGSTATNINVVHNNRSVYTRDHAFGGRQLTEEIQRRYGLSYEEAGLAKKQGGLPDNYQTDVLRPFMEAMCQEIMRALQFFYSSTPFNSVDQLLLAGGCAQIAGVDELVAARIGVPAMVANPFASMSLNSRIKPQLLSNDAPSLMIACGLALRSFDE